MNIPIASEIKIAYIFCRVICTRWLGHVPIANQADLTAAALRSFAKIQFSGLAQSGRAQGS